MVNTAPITGPIVEKFRALFGQETVHSIAAFGQFDAKPRMTELSQWDYSDKATSVCNNQRINE